MCCSSPQVGVDEHSIAGAEVFMRALPIARHICNLRPPRLNSDFEVASRGRSAACDRGLLQPYGSAQTQRGFEPWIRHSAQRFARNGHERKTLTCVDILARKQSYDSVLREEEGSWYRYGDSNPGLMAENHPS